MKKFVLLFGILASAALSAAQEPSGSGVLISPLMHRTSAQAGAGSELEFSIANPGDAAGRANWRVEAFLPEEWTYRSVVVTGHSQDAAAWFEDSTGTVNLDAGGRAELKIPYRVPRTANGCYWAILRFEPELTEGRLGTRIVYEIPLIFIVRTQDRPQVQVLPPRLDLAPDLGASGIVRLPLINESSSFVPIGASGELKDIGQNRVIASFEIEDRNLLPDSKRELGFAAPPLSDGRYELSFRPVIGTKVMPRVATTFRIRQGKLLEANSAEAASTSPLSFAPAGVSASIPAGGQRTFAVRLMNDSTEDFEADLRPGGVAQGPDGLLAAEPGLATAHAEIVGLPEKVAIKAGQSAVVRFSVKLGPEAAGDAWLSISASVAGKPFMPESLLVSASTRTGAAPKFELTPEQEIKDQGRLLAVSYALTNSGNVARRPIGQAAILEDGVRLVQRSEIPMPGSTGVIAGSTRKVTAMVPPGLKPGSYVLEVSFEYDNEIPAVTHRITFVIPEPEAKGSP